MTGRLDRLWLPIWSNNGWVPLRSITSTARRNRLAKLYRLFAVLTSLLAISVANLVVFCSKIDSKIDKKWTPSAYWKRCSRVHESSIFILSGRPEWSPNSIQNGVVKNTYHFWYPKAQKRPKGGQRLPKGSPKGYTSGPKWTKNRHKSSQGLLLEPRGTQREWNIQFGVILGSILLLFEYFFRWNIIT